MVEFQKLVQEQFSKMCQSGKLFRSYLTGNQVWDIYISSFNKEDNPIFRDPNSSYHNCNHCKNFIRRYGNVVSIDENYNVVSIFDVSVEGKFKPVALNVSKSIKSAGVSDVFFETFDELNKLPYEKCNKQNAIFRLGIDKNVKRYTKEEAEKYGVVKPNELRTFNHLHLDLPKEFVDVSGNSIERIMADFRDAKNVFYRAMREIPLDTLNLVKDLINQGSLLDGQTHLYKINTFIPLKKEYDAIEESKKELWCWVKSYRLQIAKFKNELIGVLCTELAEGKELNEACQTWNKRVDPSNYMKATAPITKKQIEDARKFVDENGYTESFDRRFATIDDIKASEILHINSGDGSVKKISMFDSVKPSVSTRHKRSEFDGIEEVSIEKFIKDILPSCSSVEAFFINKQEGNLVTLTTAKNKESKPIFKWDNNYSWTFKGNLAGKSQIKEAVKEAGGVVDAVLRFSIVWNDVDGRDNSDLDAWCIQPNQEKIGYETGFRKDRGNKFSSCKGQLDLDVTNPSGKKAVENIYFVDPSELKTGKYVFYVNQFSNRGSQGFKAQIQVDNEIYDYEYNKGMSTNEKVFVAEVYFDGVNFKIDHKLPESNSSREVYGLATQQFHKVNLISTTPNHWGENNVGNKHYLFMLEGCKFNEPIRSFHAENLIPELAKYRSVLEVLGNMNMIEPTDNQISGLGFNATVRDELIVKLQGTFKRTLKIKF